MGELQRTVDDFEAGRFRKVPDDMKEDLDAAIRAQAVAQHEPVHVWAERLAADLAAVESDSQTAEERG